MNSEMTNILIVGNGFDLSHFLPTKYDHFMIAMKNIAKWEQYNSMTFGEIFKETKEELFFSQCKRFYKTKSIEIDYQEVIKLQNLLKSNVWYNFFLNHTEEVKTWIDFELKIQEALSYVSKFILTVEDICEKEGGFDLDILISDFKSGSSKALKIHKAECEILSILQIMIKNNNFGKFEELYQDIKFATIQSQWLNVENKTEYGFFSQKYISFLYQELVKFTDIFNYFLFKIIMNLEPREKLKIISKEWRHPHKIYSFNYTDTFQKIYECVDLEYLHGKSGSTHNIVLGISDLKEEILIRLKAYGFTKYHQKIFKETDYMFIEEYKTKIRKDKWEIEELRYLISTAVPTATNKAYLSKLNTLKKSQMLDLLIQFWGHSLDLSDSDYIEDIFSLNDDVDRNVRVTIFFFNQDAKFSILNNLLAILGKGKIEEWIKKQWLKFEENPTIETIENKF